MYNQILQFKVGTSRLIDFLYYHIFKIIFLYIKEVLLIFLFLKLLPIISAIQSRILKEILKNKLRLLWRSCQHAARSLNGVPPAATATMARFMHARPIEGFRFACRGIVPVREQRQFTSKAYYKPPNAHYAGLYWASASSCSMHRYHLQSLPVSGSQ
jgi:hypothetical protein